MNPRAALAALAAIPILAFAFNTLTGLMAPLWGYALGLCIYWTLLAAAILHSTTPADRAHLLTARPAGALITTLCVIPVFALGIPGMTALGGIPAILLVGIAVAAIINGFLEELFWRGALVPAPTPPQAALAVLLFTLWHISLLFSRDINVMGGPATLLAGAAFLGTIWMAARLYTGTVGLSALSHAGVNLFAFILLAAANLPPGWEPAPL